MSTWFLSASLLISFVGLALSMRRHYANLFAAPPTRARIFGLRAAAWSLLAGTFLWAGCDEEAQGIALALWFGLATLAALLVALGLTYLPSLRSRSR